MVYGYGLEQEKKSSSAGKDDKLDLAGLLVRQLFGSM